ncbi:GNAT family N-acetyltransferase [Morganella morganii]|uniref:GNAT family N-acetyltransferase n=1 Tax=Morganella morganii TaxID=582 RepID=UPI003D7F7B59
MTSVSWQTAALHDLSPQTLYRLLALRSAVFVVEQTCCYLDPDGADLTALHVWAEQDGEIMACCRILPPEHSTAPAAIGRVVINPLFRGQKLGYPLMDAAVQAVYRHFGTRQINISAQAHLTAFYKKCGFTVCSDVYDEDGIPHCDMFRPALLLSAQERRDVMIFADSDPDENPWVAGKPRTAEITVSEYDPAWPAVYAQEKQRILDVLGDKALHIEHVGSTAVPGLAAKPVIDIDLIVADPADETDWLPALIADGYEHTVREPSWYQHRMLKRDNPQINLHVFAPRCPEHLRHILFRDWLITHPDDRADYAQSKMTAKDGVSITMDYNRKKHDTVQQIYARLFAALP